MLIYLIGFMGCGKTTLGKELAAHLKYNFIDLDSLIEAQAGKTITDIFKDSGEQAFRGFETDALKIVSEMEHVVVATGGGTPCYNENMELMNKTGTTVYIQMKPGSLFHRIIPSKSKRPLVSMLSDVQLMEFILDKLPFREPFYLEANLIFKGENLKAENIQEKILLHK